MVANEYHTLHSPMDTWTDEQVKLVNLNAKAIRILYEALSPSKFNRISYCDTALEIWRMLSVTHERTTLVK